MHACAANGSKPRPASLSSSCPALHSRRLRFPHGHPRFLLLPRRAAPLPRWGLLKHVDMVSTTRNRKKGQDPGKKSMEKEYWNYNNESGSLIDINPSYQNWHQGKQTNETRNKNNTRAVGQLQRHPPSFALAPAFFAAHLDVTPMRDGYWELAESLCWRPHLSTDRRPAIILDLCILGVQK